MGRLPQVWGCRMAGSYIVRRESESWRKTQMTIPQCHFGHQEAGWYFYDVLGMSPSEREVRDILNGGAINCPNCGAAEWRVFALYVWNLLVGRRLNAVHE